MFHFGRFPEYCLGALGAAETGACGTEGTWVVAAVTITVCCFLDDSEPCRPFLLLFFHFLLSHSFMPSISTGFLPFLLLWPYSFLAYLLALSKLSGFVAITFPWIREVSPQMNRSIFFPSDVIMPGHNRDSSLNLDMYASMSEFWTLRFHNSCYIF